MSSDHGHDSHGSKWNTAPSWPKHSVTNGAAGAMIGMFWFLFTGLFDGKWWGGGGHGHH